MRGAKSPAISAVAAIVRAVACMFAVRAHRVIFVAMSSSKHHLVRLIGAAFVLIALSLAPSIAVAHAGHDHGGRTALTHAAPGDHARSSNDAAATHMEFASAAISDFQTRVLLDCAGQCCCGVPCTACCAVAVPAVFEPSPPLGRAPIPLWNRSLVWQLHPDGLRRPPRSLA